MRNAMKPTQNETRYFYCDNCRCTHEAGYICNRGDRNELLKQIKQTKNGRECVYY